MVTLRFVNPSRTSHSYCLVLCVGRTLKIYSLSDFQIHNTVLLAGVREGCTSSCGETARVASSLGQACASLVASCLVASQGPSAGQCSWLLLLWWFEVELSASSCFLLMPSGKWCLGIFYIEIPIIFIIDVPSCIFFFILQIGHYMDLIKRWCVWAF